jgi:hypothetical protein
MRRAGIKPKLRGSFRPIGRDRNHQRLLPRDVGIASPAPRLRDGGHSPVNRNPPGTCRGRLPEPLMTAQTVTEMEIAATTSAT